MIYLNQFGVFTPLSIISGLVVLVSFVYFFLRQESSKLFHVLLEKIKDKNSWEKVKEDVYKNDKLTVSCMKSFNPKKISFSLLLDDKPIDKFLSKKEKLILEKEFKKVIKKINDKEIEIIAEMISNIYNEKFKQCNLTFENFDKEKIVLTCYVDEDELSKIRKLHDVPLKHAQIF